MVVASLPAARHPSHRLVDEVEIKATPHRLPRDLWLAEGLMEESSPSCSRWRYRATCSACALSAIAELKAAEGRASEGFDDSEPRF